MKLEVGKTYTLKHSDQFCHLRGATQVNDISGDYIFVGTIKVAEGERNIFYKEKEGTYAMFSNRKLEGYIEDYPSELEKHIIEVNNYLEKLLEKANK